MLKINIIYLFMLIIFIMAKPTSHLVLVKLIIMAKLAIIKQNSAKK
jgi:hypothetical protein